jgi:hypothetical protein
MHLSFRRGFEKNAISLLDAVGPVTGAALGSVAGALTSDEDSKGKGALIGAALGAGQSIGNIIARSRPNPTNFSVNMGAALGGGAAIGLGLGAKHLAGSDITKSPFGHRE